MSQQHLLQSLTVIVGHVSSDLVPGYQYPELTSWCVRNLHRYISQRVNKSELETLTVSYLCMQADTALLRMH